MVKKNKKSSSAPTLGGSNRKGNTERSSRAVGQFLGRFTEAHQLHQDNEHIHSGYRVNFDSPKRIVKSLFLLHNETVNIWTHLIGAIIVFFFIFQGIAYEMQESHILGKAIIKDFVQPYSAGQFEMLAQMDPKQLCAMLNEDLQQGEIPFECQNINMNSTNKVKSEQNSFSNEIATWPIVIALLGGAICLACSAVFHWIYPLNAKIYKLSLSLDYAGIGINMAFSPIPAFYYSLYCHQTTALTYITLIFIAGTVSFTTSLIDWFNKKEHFKIKAVILSVSAVICVVGLIHLMVNEFKYGNYGDGYSIVPSLYFFIPTLLSYACGFYTYMRKCPERYYPGKFDICGHSHQIWHVFVFSSVILTYLGSLACFQVRSKWPVCPPESFV